MAAFVKVTIDESAEHDAWSYTGVKYVLEDCRLLSVHQCAAWCRRCRTIVHAERVPTVAEIESLIDDYDRPGNNYLASFGEAAVAMLREEDFLRLAWRRSRVSPAKCLECGREDIFRIDEEGSLDPVTGLRFRISGYGFAELITEPEMRLSTEGVILSRSGC